MSNYIAPDDFVAILQECFSRGQMFTFVPGGKSMLPMLDGKKDKVTFAPKPERLNKYDVVFYRRPQTGQLVLHRLVGFTKSGGYIFCGDNQYAYEYGIGDSDILAMMIAFTHHGKERQTTDFSYRLYVHFMMIKKFFRRFASKIYHTLFKKKQ